MSDIIIIDTITADQIEDHDQIILDGELLANVKITGDDEYAIYLTADSYETGDRDSYELPYDYEVEVWAV